MLHLWTLTLFLLNILSGETAKLHEKESACGEVYQQLCPGGSKNEFSVISCIMRETIMTTAPAEIPSECKQEVWDFKARILTDSVYSEQMKKRCGSHVSKYCTGREKDVMVCMLDNRQALADGSQEAGACRNFLTNIANIVFSDYHLVIGFLNACSADVKKLSCGTITDSIDESSSSQAEVISCLETKMSEVSTECKAVLQVKEEQAADTFKLDKALFYACREDREVLCKDTPDDAGAVYDCLYRVKFDKRLSGKCREEVVRRQLLLLEDYKIDYGLKVSCGQDLVTHCLDSRTSHKLEEGFMRTVLILNCLSDVSLEDDKNRVPVSDKCLQRVEKVKTMIMGDIELTPILGITCHKDVQQKCSDVSPNEEGGVINCLMQLQATEGALEQNCAKTLEEFVILVDPISDVTLNHALMQNCGTYITEHCDTEEEEGEVMECLIDLEFEIEIKESCHLQLLSYKYFMSRSIKLDKPLMRVCEADAYRLCENAMNEVMVKKDTRPMGAVISCLYHHIFMEGDKKVSDKCIPELKRTIIAQGESVNLSPNVVSACAEDLVNYCSGFQTDKDDYGCLQSRMISDNAEPLSSKCREEMELHAQLVANDVRNDYRLMKACRDVIHKSCSSHMNADQHGGLLGCLVEQKNNLRGTCLKHVTDLQLISLYDFKFNKEFVDACNGDVQTFCKLDVYGAPLTKKQDVMYCLRDEIMKGSRELVTVSKACKNQLREEFMRQMADLDLDAQLKKSCSTEFKTVCSLDRFEDKLQVMECLRENEEKLSTECKAKVFTRELQQAEDPGIDAYLQKTCTNAINLYCSQSESGQLMSCLEANIHKSGVSNACKATLKARMKKEHSNFKLNNELRQACKEDVKSHCNHVLQDIKNGKITDARGLVISCLKDNIDVISVECEQQITTILEQEVEDYELDPVLTRRCRSDIDRMCGDKPNDKVEACLRDHITDIVAEDCTKQVIRLITETHGDVHLDPVLMTACQKDISYLCGRMLPGKGNVIACLQGHDQKDSNSISPTCSKMLQSRVQMWSNAYQRAKQYDSAIEMMDDLYRSIDNSQYKQEVLFYLGIAVFLVILIGFCGGRCTKRKPPNKLY